MILYNRIIGDYSVPYISLNSASWSQRQRTSFTSLRDPERPFTMSHCTAAVQFATVWTIEFGPHVYTPTDEMFCDCTAANSLGISTGKSGRLPNMTVSLSSGSSKAIFACGDDE